MENETRRSTILVVDDDPAILEYAGGVLEECGYAVLTAPNAATALVMLRNNERVDLLFTDLVMPGSDGIELARRAGEEIPSLKVLLRQATRETRPLEAPCSRSPIDRTSSPVRSPQHWPGKAIEHRIILQRLQ